MNTTANKITVVRIILIPIFLVLAYMGMLNWAFVVYIIACLSDVADGYIARHYDQVTSFGKFADPLADKMLVLSAMCVLIERGQMPGWVVAVVLCREFAVSGLRLVAVEQNRVIAAAWSGKLKTGCTMVGLAVMLVLPQARLVNIICSALILITTVFSGVQYFCVNLDVFKKENI